MRLSESCWRGEGKVVPVARRELPAGASGATVKPECSCICSVLLMEHRVVLVQSEKVYQGALIREGRVTSFPAANFLTCLQDLAPSPCWGAKRAVSLS